MYYFVKCFQNLKLNPIDGARHEFGLVQRKRFVLRAGFCIRIKCQVFVPKTTRNANKSIEKLLKSLNIKKWNVGFLAGKRKLVVKLFEAATCFSVSQDVHLAFLENLHKNHSHEKFHNLTTMLPEFFLISWVALTEPNIFIFKVSVALATIEVYR